MADRPLIFLSHIHDEAPLASVFKKHIEKTFGGMLDVFVSSDPGSIAPGDVWFAKISDALDDAVAQIVLCSKSSTARPWINFEAGAAWRRDIPVIVICHSGMTKGQLPSPLGAFQALTANIRGDLKNLVRVITERVSAGKTPSAEYAKWLDGVTAFEAEYLNGDGSDDLPTETQLNQSGGTATSASSYVFPDGQSVALEQVRSVQADELLRRAKDPQGIVRITYVDGSQQEFQVKYRSQSHIAREIARLLGGDVGNRHGLSQYALQLLMRAEHPVEPSQQGMVFRIRLEELPEPLIRAGGETIPPDPCNDRRLVAAIAAKAFDDLLTSGYLEHSGGGLFVMTQPGIELARAETERIAGEPAWFWEQ